MSTFHQDSEQGSNEKQQPCKDYFGDYGICPKGDSCPFAHGEDAIVVRSEEDIGRWQAEELKGGNSKWSGQELETLAKILRERLRQLLNKPNVVRTDSPEEVETNHASVEVNKGSEMSSLNKESVVSRDGKRSASEVGLQQEDNTNKVFRGSRPVVRAMQNSRIRWKTRQSTADVFFNEYLKKGVSEGEACERAIREEEDIFRNCEDQGEIVYTNTAGRRFRKLLKTALEDIS